MEFNNNDSKLLLCTDVSMEIGGKTFKYSNPMSAFCMLQLMVKKGDYSKSPKGRLF